MWCTRGESCALIYTAEGRAGGQDKEITIEIELHQEGDLDLVDASQLRIFSDKGTFFDLWLDPVDTNGRRIETGYILRGRITLSKHVANAGYWRPDQITLYGCTGQRTT